MSGITGIDAARAYFEGDRFAVNAGISIDEVAPGYAVCHFDITPDHLNAENGVMGGAIFTLIDLAFAAAANGIHLPTVAQQVSMNFLSGSRGATLTATARCRKDGKTTGVYNVDVVDDLGRDIAQAVVTGYKLKT
ncbi:MAG: PaaI family thioesterase [Clostridia bacterium]|nr:PaaI family thioesterase [Clostridia bacterium]